MKKKISAVCLALVIAALTLCMTACTEGEKAPEYAPGTVYEVSVVNGTGGGVYRAGEICTVTAPDPDSDHVRFVGWFSDGVKVSVEQAYEFEVTKDVSLEAEFAERTDFVTVTVIGGYVGDTGFSEAKVEKGSKVQAVSDENQTRSFRHWIVDGEEELVTADPYEFTAEHDITITAVYDKICMVTVENGTIPSGKSLYTSGEECTVVADAGTDNSEFYYWYYETPQGQEVKLSEDSTYTFTVSSTISLKVKYTRFSTVTVEGGTLYGTGLSEGKFVTGSLCTLVADPAPENKKFVGWNINGDKISSVVSSYQLRLNAQSYTVAAEYADVTETLPALENTVQGFNWYNPDGIYAQAAEFFRYGNPSSLFEKAEYLEYYVYDSVDADPDEYIAMFNVFNNDNAGYADVMSSVDGQKTIEYVGGSGDACFMGDDIELKLYPFMRYVIGDSYDPAKNYYFAIRQIGKVDGATVYGDSELSPIGLGAYNETGTKVRV